MLLQMDDKSYLLLFRIDSVHVSILRLGRNCWSEELSEVNGMRRITR